MQNLKDKVVLISGAGSGIGAALAREAARRGAKVAASDVRREMAEAVREEVSRAGGAIIALELDVTSADSWRAAADRTERELGPIDVLCSNAGVGPAMKSVLDVPMDYLRWIFDVNVFGGVNGVKCVAPRMIERGHGHILFTASVAGFASGGILADYNASKHALIAICCSLRDEFAGTGVGVSALCPAAVATGLMNSTVEVAPKAMTQSLLEKREEAASRIAALAGTAGGVMTAEEVAHRGLEGALAGEFYIFTHADSRDMTMKRATEVGAIFDQLAAGGATTR